MLNDDRTRDLLRSAVSGLTVTTPPAEELVRRGRQSRRRSRAATALGAAAAVTVVAVGSVLVSDLAQTPVGPTATPPTMPIATKPSAHNGLVTPPGTRLVGMGPVAVAVPDSWGTNNARCGTPLADTVVFETTGTRDCLVPPRDVSSVHFGRIGMWEPRRWEQNATTTMDLGGVEITRSDIGPYDEGPGEPAYDFAVGVVTVPGHDVAMWVVSTDRELIRRILDSIRDIPAGYVAVPVPSPPELTSSFEEDAGLDVRRVTVYRAGLAPGVLLSSDPAFGSIVPAGSSVTHTVSGPGEPLSGPAGALARNLHAFAVAPGAETLRAIPFGDHVGIGLGVEMVKTLTPSQLEQPSAWVIHRDHFAGYSGPFSVLNHLRGDPELWSITEGKQLFCQWARTAALPGYEQDRRLTIEPSSITSCLQWWAVDIYLDERGRIDAVILNLDEP